MAIAEKDRVTLCAGAYHKKRKMISAERERERGGGGGERERVMEFRGKKNTPISPLSFMGILIQLRKYRTYRQYCIVHTVNVQWCREVKVSFSHINLPGQSTIFPSLTHFVPNAQ
jgi:hypothetical protein